MQHKPGHNFHIPWFPFRGIITPVFTPFDANKDIDFTVIPKYAAYLHKSGTAGILVNGTTGEGTSLTMEERKHVLEAWVTEAHKYSMTIMVHVGGTNMKDVKSLAQHAEKCRVSSILTLADLFFKPSSVDDLIHYLKIVSAEAPHTPLLYYHIPHFTGININLKELMERTSEVPTMVGIKFTDNDLVLGSSCIEHNANDTNQHCVFLGCDSLCLPALFLGINSAIATTNNIFPSHIQEIFKHFNEKEYEKALKAQNHLNSCIQQITAHGPWVSSMKAAMKRLTPVDVGPVRDPLIEVNLDDVKFNFQQK